MCPLEVPVEQLGVRDPDAETLLGFLREMEFATLTKRIAEGLERRGAAAGRAAGGAEPAAAHGRGGSAPHAEARRQGRARRRGATPQAAVALAQRRQGQKIDRSKYETVTELPQLEAWIAEARAAGRFAFDTETTSLDPMQAEFVGFSMAVAPGKACYVPLGHRAGSGSLRFRRRRSRSRCRSREALALLQAAAGGRLRPQDRAEPQVRLPGAAPARHRRSAPLDDTMLLSYALDGGRGQHGMDALAERHLGHTCMSVRAGARARARRQEIRQDLRARCRSTRRPSTPPRMPTSRCGCGWC